MWVLQQEMILEVGEKVLNILREYIQHGILVT